MTRRGRPPHPDVLTPREWEVLALLREGLTDQAIADRLNISLDGAKYHVREILSKLGVASRQEAAAWQPEAPAPARRWTVLTLAARIAGALVMVAAVAGLVLLAIGVVLNSKDSGTDGDLSELGEPAVSKDAAIDVAREASAYLMRGSLPETTDVVRQNRTFWKVTFTGRFPLYPNPGGVTLQPSPPGGYCADIVVLVYTSSPGTRRIQWIPSDSCN